MGSFPWIFILRFLSFILLSTASLAQAEEISLSRFLKTFAEENRIQIEGIELVGNEVFTPPRQPKSVDKTLRRALARFNTIEHYDERGIVKLVIVGRKGTDVGALPDDYPEAHDLAQPAEQE